MYPGLQAAVNDERQINEVDVQRDAYLFDVGRSFMIVPGNDPKITVVTVVPNGARTKFGMRQPRIKAPGTKASTILLSPYDPTLVFIGTQSGVASFFKVPPNGLKGDLNKPAAQADLKDEIKCAAFHPIAKNIIAIGLRNGHVGIYDDSLKTCHIDLVHSRPLNSVAWSDDGKLVFALYVDMLIKVWDVRANTVLCEFKASQTRGLGYLAALPDRKVLLSFSQAGKQELRVYDETMKEVASRQVGVGGTPLTVSVHFTGLILAITNHDKKVAVLDGNTLAEIASCQAYQPVLGAGVELVKPDPDGSLVMSASCVTTANSIVRVEFNVPSAPAKFERPCPTWETTVDAAAWVAGEDGTLATEALVATVKEEVKEVVEEVKEVAPQTHYKYLQAHAEMPSQYYIHLPVGQAPNPEFNEICTNGKDFAFVGAGNTPPIIVMPLYKPMRYPKDWKQVIVDPHGAGVNTITFSPHDPQLLASGGEDATVKLWELPTEWTEPLREPVLKLSHQRKVTIAKFSQSTRNLMMTCSVLPELNFWDLNTYKKVRSFDHLFQQPIQDAEMDEYSSMVYTILRDGTLTAFDPRAENPEVVSTMAHKHGGRHRRVLNIPDFGYVATFGSSNRGERQIAIWDKKNLTNPLKTIELDTATGSMLPMYEEGSGLIYLGGKGDGHVRYVELCKDDRVIASSGVYETSAPERGLCLVARKHVDVMGCEVSRMLKIATDSMHVVHWKILRSHTELFQDMIYPPIRDTTNPLMEVSDWLDGANETWPMMNFQPEGTKKASEVLPTFKHRASGKFAAEMEAEENKPKALTIETMVAAAPKISSDDDDDDSDEDSDW